MQKRWSVLTLALVAGMAQAQGPYVAMALAQHQVIAGALARDGTDVLVRDSRLEPGARGGWRWALGSSWAVAIELGLFHTSGALERQFGANTVIRYEPAGPARELGGRIGPVFDAALVGAPVWGYLRIAESRRKFDVSVHDLAGSLRQSDEQGQLQVGLGVEIAWRAGWRASAGIGRARADFGDRRTDMQGGRVTEVSFDLSRGW